jgi:nicotinamidase-related amidase
MKPALLVIDIQNEYFAPHGKWVLPEGEHALERIQTLLAGARAAGIPVFHIVHESLDPAGPVFAPGSVGAEMHPAIVPLPGERRLTKHVPGAFTGTPLEIYLRRAGVDTVIVSGYMTHLCCDTTSRQARERGFDVLFAADATATRDLARDGATVPHAAIQQATLAIMATSFARVLPVETILAKVSVPAAVAES